MTPPELTREEFIQHLVKAGWRQDEALAEWKRVYGLDTCQCGRYTLTKDQLLVWQPVDAYTDRAHTAEDCETITRPAGTRS